MLAMPCLGFVGFYQLLKDANSKIAKIGHTSFLFSTCLPKDWSMFVDILKLLKFMILAQSADSTDLE